MILAFELNNIAIDNVFFLETRNNIIMDGKFTKIVYSDENIVTSGIYMNVPINEFIIDKPYNRVTMKHTKNNNIVIQQITDIEHYILQNFKLINASNKQVKYLLKEQLDTRSLKIYRDCNHYAHNSNICGKIVLKISGVWEDNYNIGITYKLIESFSLT
jgi:hypothetical protein